MVNVVEALSHVLSMQNSRGSRNLLLVADTAGHAVAWQEVGLGTFGFNRRSQLSVSNLLKK